ncbi:MULTISPECIES: nuclease-related domain-containing protein [Bacillaceae]|uniref:NERD domain-containing protein n=1 Tax=Evansella alkalicola TaxID=745819 RepID=A0ABS6K066_9BACI|nr:MULTISPECIES: nuclease-related domain-containing protein [Bacillaceae]MBU9723721.1 NERD domain-containing protein [Bacillus alkalicola]
MVTLLKPREFPLKLKLQKILQCRSKLPEDIQLYFSNQVKGFQGEEQFDELLKGLNGHGLVLNDLLFELNNSEFQIDSAIISHSSIYIFEIKTSEGDYYIQDRKWYFCNSNKEAKNFMIQLERTEASLRQLLHSLGIHLTIKPFLVFVNQKFTLKQAPKDLPIIYPTQLHNFINHLQGQLSVKLNQRHMKYAEAILSQRKEEDQYRNLPKYALEELDSGVFCENCGTSYIHISNKMIIKCPNCLCSEKMDEAILRTIKELIWLFPDMKITTELIYNWCGGAVSVRSIRRVLVKNFSRMGYGKNSYYVEKRDRDSNEDLY